MPRPNGTPPNPPFKRTRCAPLRSPRNAPVRPQSVATHSFSLLPDTYAVVRLGPSDPIPTWAARSSGLVSITRTVDELSIVCLQSSTLLDVRVERGWRAFKLHGPFPFEQVGVLASFAGPLARAGVSVFVISTFDTDYILVKAVHLEHAIQALAAAGHTFFP